MNTVTVAGDIDFKTNKMTGTAKTTSIPVRGNVSVPVGEYYHGEYDITPSQEAQTIPAKGKVASQNIVIEPIPSQYIVPQGTKSITGNGTGIDVTTYASVDVDVPAPTPQSGSAKTPDTTITANPAISVDANGLITATASESQSVTPTVEEGWVSEGTAGTITVTGSKTSQLSTQGGSTITPTESQQTAVPSGKYTTGDIIVDAIPSDYVGSGITSRSGADLSASGKTVSVPSGYYAESATKDVATGNIGVPYITKGTVTNNSVILTPFYNRTGGYIADSGTYSGVQTTVSASELVSGTKSITGNGTEIDVTNYASVDVSVSPSLESQTKTYTPTESIQTETVSPSTGYDGLSSVGITVNAIPSTYRKKYEFVQRLYSANFNLSTGTSYDTWTASTTAGSILATTSLSSNTFVADMANYEYLLWWKMWIQLAYNSGATLKAMPIWEGMDAIQSVFRRPSSLTEIQSATKGGNACVTQTTAPLLRYYDTNGAVKYTWSNSNGIYGTVQAATFSSSTSLTPTVTPKRPIIYAKCSSSYFATGRKTQVDSANCTFYMTCDLYRQPIDVYGQTKAYEGIVSTYNSSQS